MIKSHQYNEISYSSNEELFDNIMEFSKTGDLNFPVKHYSDIKPAFDFFNGVLNIEQMKALFDNNILIHPLDFEFNHNEKTISYSKYYNFYWFREHSNKYIDIIIPKFKSFLNDYLKNDYSNYIFDNTKKNCLVSILKNLPHPEILTTFFNTIPNAKELLLDSYTANKIFFKESITNDFYSFNTKHKYENIIILFLNNAIDYNSLIESTRDFKETIDYAISNNNFEYLKKLISINKNILTEYNDSSYLFYSFIGKAKSIEMFEFLNDNGLDFLNFTEDNKLESIFNSNYNKINIDIVKHIIKKSNFELLKNEDYIVDFLFSLNNKDTFNDLAKFLIDHKFPLHNYEIFYHYPEEDLSLKIKESLSLGWNPLINEQLISKIISHRDTKLFNSLQKTKIINLLSPDGIANILSKTDHTQSTLNLLNNAKKEDVNALTLNGIPAWFSANTDSFKKINSMIDNFLQIDNNGLNVFSHIEKNKKENYHSYVLEIISNLKQNNIPHTFKENNKNMLHHMFKVPYKTDLDKKDIELLSHFENSNLHQLFSSLDEHGKFPIEYLTKSFKDALNPRFWAGILEEILNINQFHLDYSKKNKDGESLLDLTLKFFENQPSIIEKINLANDRILFNLDLKENLPTNDLSKKTIKI